MPGSIRTLLNPDRAETPVEETDTAVFYSISNCQPGLAGVSFGNSLIKQVVEDLKRGAAASGCIRHPLPHSRAGEMDGGGAAGRGG